MCAHHASIRVLYIAKLLLLVLQMLPERLQISDIHDHGTSFQHDQLLTGNIWNVVEPHVHPFASTLDGRLTSSYVCLSL